MGAAGGGEGKASQDGHGGTGRVAEVDVAELYGWGGGGGWGAGSRVVACGGVDDGFGVREPEDAVHGCVGLVDAYVGVRGR